jgi:hypothetical protein
VVLELDLSLKSVDFLSHFLTQPDVNLPSKLAEIVSLLLNEGSLLEQSTIEFLPDLLADTSLHNVVVVFECLQLPCANV